MNKVICPKDWVVVSISQVVSASGLISDGDWVESKDQDVNGSVRLIQLADIGDGYFRNKSQRFMTSEKVIELNGTYLKKGDVLVARMPDPLGRACVFPGIGQDAVTVVDVCLIRTNEQSGMTSALLKYWINSPTIRSKIEANASGTTRKRITRKKLEQFELPLPPLAEQKIIVEKLDTLLAQVETTKARLERVPQILKRFRQSVLAAAVSGRLTEEWRGQLKFKASTMTLGDAAIFIDYRGKTPTKTTSGIPLITAKNIRPGFISREPREYIAEDNYETWMTRGTPRIGDVLVTTEAPMGNVANVDLDYRFALAQRAICLQFIEDVNPYYASIFMQARKFQKELEENSTGTTVQGIKAARLKKISIEYPCLSEQTEIVRRVEQLFAHADTIEQQVNNALAKVNNLTQSILAKAFRGELTEQWRRDNPELISGDNSAAALLARIQAERAATAKSVRRKAKT